MVEFVVDLDDPWPTHRLTLSAVLAQFDDPRIGVEYRTIKARWQQELPEDFATVYSR